MTGFVRTIRGDLPATELGVVDYHDHLFQVSPLLPGDELADEMRSAQEASALRQVGVGCLVEATPIGLGRRPSALLRIAGRLGLHIVHTTGVHREAHYANQPWITQLSTEELLAEFRAEIVDGLLDDGERSAVEPRRLPGRAGLVKIGIGYWSLSGFERRALEAAGTLSADCGVPVMVHLEHGSAAHEVLTMLAEMGCKAERVVLAHMDRNPDPGLQLELAARGAYLGYDGCARHRSWPDSVLIDCLAKVMAGGGEKRVLLGGDVARSSRFESYGGMPGLTYTYRRFLPRVRSVIGQDATGLLTIQNPARWLTWHSPADAEEYGMG